MWESLCAVFVFSGFCLFVFDVTGIQKVSMNCICSQHLWHHMCEFSPYQEPVLQLSGHQLGVLSSHSALTPLGVSVIRHRCMSSFPQDCPYPRRQSQIPSAQGSRTFLFDLAIKLRAPPHAPFQIWLFAGTAHSAQGNTWLTWLQRIHSATA